jgi:hypothetical protein
MNYNRPDYICLSCEQPDLIFVFGSNLQGIHGAGAAKHAVEKHGAIYGIGVGMQGDSYAIPSKDEHIQTLPLDVIYQYAAQFTEFAVRNPDKKFFITRIGCGLAGYTDIQIAPAFVNVPDNCVLPDLWQIK